MVRRHGCCLSKTREAKIIIYARRRCYHQRRDRKPDSHGVQDMRTGVWEARSTAVGLTWRHSITTPYPMAKLSESRRHCQCLLPSSDSERGIHNMIDWDCGPGNMFLNAAMSYCADGQLEHEKDAEWARQDTVDQDSIDKFLDHHPYINHAQHKTMGCEIFVLEKLNLYLTNAFRNVHQGTILLLPSLGSRPRTSYVRSTASAQRQPSRNPWTSTSVEEAPSTLPLGPPQSKLPLTRVFYLGESSLPSPTKDSVTFALQEMEAIHGRPRTVPINSDTLMPPFINGKTAAGKEWRSLMTRAQEFGNVKNLPMVEEPVLAEKYFMWKLGYSYFGNGQICVKHCSRFFMSDSLIRIRSGSESSRCCGKEAVLRSTQLILRHTRKWLRRGLYSFNTRGSSCFLFSIIIHWYFSAFDVSQFSMILFSLSTIHSCDLVPRLTWSSFRKLKLQLTFPSFSLVLSLNLTSRQDFWITYLHTGSGTLALSVGTLLRIPVSPSWPLWGHLLKI